MCSHSLKVPAGSGVLLALAAVAGAIFTSGLLTPNQAHADTLYMANGDRLSGTLVEVAGGNAVLQSPYAGEMTLPLAEVRGIETDQPVTIEGPGGAVYRGSLQVEDGSQRLMTPEGSVPLTLNNVIWLVPSEEEELLIEALEPPAEAVPLEPPEEAGAFGEFLEDWQGHVESGLIYRSGTTETTDANLALRLMQERPRYKLTLDAAANYGEVESEINTRRYFGQGKLQFYPREALYTYGLTSLEQDRGRKLELRWDLAGGVGYDFIKTEDRVFSADVGLGYTREWWNQYSLSEERVVKAQNQQAFFQDIRAYLSLLRTTPLLSGESAWTALQLGQNLQEYRFDNEISEDDNMDLRLSSHFEQALFWQSRLTSDLTLLPNLEGGGEYRLISDLALSTPLSEDISLRMNLKTEYDSEPGSWNVENMENTLLTTLRYEF